MRQTARMSDIQHTNLNILVMMRDWSRDNLPLTCLTFATFSREQLERIAELDSSELADLVQHLGSEPIFAAHPQLDQILNTPAHLLPMITATQSPTSAHSASL